MGDKITVMLVDDSSVIRRALSNTLEKEPDIEIVASAANGQVGVDMARLKKPDIVILDVEMPIMDGLTALPLILKESPSSKVVMFSTLTAKGADTTLKAMALGAIECVVKPSAQSANNESNFQDYIINLIKTLYKHKLSKAAAAASTDALSTAPASKDFSLLKDPMAFKDSPSLLAIGSSTGGPNALFEVCSHLKNLPAPVVITQHMPPTFTKVLAQHISEKTGVPTAEGEDGMPLKAGHIYVAPGGFHMLFEKSDNGPIIRLDDSAPVNFCKPAVDPMLSSALDVFGHKILTAILTGMGSDGLGGCKAVAQQHGRVIAQDEQTCTVWGMPRAVTLEGICEEVLPLQSIGPWLKKQFI
ncbi:MAG TPA: chemotaxis response regulator protein-glutamate methylesterase [Rhodospirillaceae bacterium]|nr:chemotaxis response regulator protein-glutamate methylesterase [Rhodospirillaceae bacterium]|tara:strand:+ start:29575 stop:30648 length:1074 start_codon:yes stop_codon:yes gene_type:complete